MNETIHLADWLEAQGLNAEKARRVIFLLPHSDALYREYAAPTTITAVMLKHFAIGLGTPVSDKARQRA